MAEYRVPFQNHELSYTLLHIAREEGGVNKSSSVKMQQDMKSGFLEARKNAQGEDWGVIVREEKTV